MITRLPLRYQILLAPALIIVMIAGLLWFTLSQLDDIRRQNETVRGWVRICERTQTALSAGQRLETIIANLTAARRADSEDLHFSYLEQSRLFTESLLDPEVLEKTPAELRPVLVKSEAIIGYRENLQPRPVRSSLDELLPRLQSLNSAFGAQKRAAYTEYYNNVNAITARLIAVSLVTMAVSIVGGIALSLWAIRRTTQRLGDLAGRATAVCAGNLASMPAPDSRRDELDTLADCLARMTERLIHIVSTEKVLQGSEEERQRIAMDLHDQTLSDLTNLRRDLHALQVHPPTAPALATRLAAIEEQLDDTANNIRDIMDDLHPRVLDLLGLEAALRAHLEKHLSRPDLPAWQLHVDAGADTALTALQRLTYYRIALEAMHNAVRHSGCTRYEVDCRILDREVILSVEDNGSGMARGGPRHPDGRGLGNIGQRASAIGARAQWLPARFSTGTRFELRLAIAGGTG